MTIIRNGNENKYKCEMKNIKTTTGMIIELIFDDEIPDDDFTNVYCITPENEIYGIYEGFIYELERTNTILRLANNENVVLPTIAEEVIE